MDRLFYTYLIQVYTVVDEMFLAGEIRETSQTKVLKQLTMYNSLEQRPLPDIDMQILISSVILIFNFFVMSVQLKGIYLFKLLKVLNIEMHM